MHRLIGPLRILVRAACVLVAAVALSTPLLQRSAAAQTGALCADPRAYCLSTLPIACEPFVKSEEGAATADAACAASITSYRSCLREAADCPGLVDQPTPKAPREASVACAAGECADAPQKAAIREAPESPDPPKEQ